MQFLSLIFFKGSGLSLYMIQINTIDSVQTVYPPNTIKALSWVSRQMGVAKFDVHGDKPHTGLVLGEVIFT